MASNTVTETSKDNEQRAQIKRQRIRSLVIALGLGFLAVSFYAATIVRLGSSVASRTL